MRRKQAVEINVDEVTSDYLPEFQRVVSHVQYRYLSGKASAGAVRQDLEKLRVRFPNPKPDPSTFDLDTELRWTFPMALAWIVWRSPEKVAEFSPSYRSAVRTWGNNYLFRHGIDVLFETLGEPAPDLIQLPRDGVLCDLRKESEADDSAYLPMERARLELWRTLLSVGDKGMLADGVPHFEKRRVAIPHREFADLELVSSDGHDASLRSSWKGGGYGAPRLNPDDLRQRWRVASPRKTGLISAEAQFRAWLTEQILASPHAPTLKNKEIWDAVKASPGMAALSKASFEKVKREVTAELSASAWRAGGRR